MLMVGGCFNIYTNLLAAPDSRHNPFVCPLAASGCSLHAAAEWILGIIYYRGSSPSYVAGAAVTVLKIIG